MAPPPTIGSGGQWGRWGAVGVMGAPPLAPPHLGGPPLELPTPPPIAPLSPRYASLYFCCAIEGADNELLTLELIHRYVELLDKYFGSVRQGQDVGGSGPPSTVTSPHLPTPPQPHFWEPPPQEFPLSCF